MIGYDNERRLARLMNKETLTSAERAERDALLAAYDAAQWSQWRDSNTALIDPPCERSDAAW